MDSDSTDFPFGPTPLFTPRRTFPAAIGNMLLTLSMDDTSLPACRIVEYSLVAQSDARRLLNSRRRKNKVVQDE